MIVAAVLSLKGGVGKTTITLGLASAAVQRGISTLLVDLDPQGNATVSTDAEARPDGVAAVLADPRRSVVNAVVTGSPWSDRLRVLPGGEATEPHNHPNPGARQLARLSLALTKVDPAPELVLIDCPPSLGQLTRSALVAADRAILVAEPSLYAVAGVQRALAAVQAERGVNDRLQPLGVVVNRCRPRLREHEFRLAELRDIFGPLILQPALPDRVAVQQAEGAAQPIHRWTTPGAREVADIFDRHLDRLLRSVTVGRGKKSDQHRARKAAG